MVQNSWRRGISLYAAYIAQTADEASDMLGEHPCLACGKNGQYIAGDKGKKQLLSDLVIYYKVGMRCECGFINFVYLVYNDIARAKNPKVLPARDALQRATELNVIPDPRLEELFTDTKVYAFRGQIHEAISVARVCVEAYPEHVSAVYNLAVLLLQVKDYEPSLRYFKKAIDLDPTFTAAWYQTGILFEESGRYREALDYFNKFLALRPKHVDGIARKNRCELLLERKGPENTIISI